MTDNPKWATLNRWGRDGFETAQAASDDARRTIPMDDFAVLYRSGPLRSGYAWVWPSEYADQLVEKDVNIIRVVRVFRVID